MLDHCASTVLREGSQFGLKLLKTWEERKLSRIKYTGHNWKMVCWSQPSMKNLNGWSILMRAVVHTSKPAWRSQQFFSDNLIIQINYSKLETSTCRTYQDFMAENVQKKFTWQCRETPLVAAQWRPDEPSKWPQASLCKLVHNSKTNLSNNIWSACRANGHHTNEIGFAEKQSTIIFLRQKES